MRSPPDEWTVRSCVVLRTSSQQKAVTPPATPLPAGLVTFGS